MQHIDRLQNELKNLQKNRKFGFYARPRDSKRMLNWDAQIYKDGYFFQLEMIFSKDYPIRPPKCRFTTEMFNPNIYPSGDICLDLLGSRWKPTITIQNILDGLVLLLEEPNPASPANCTAAVLYNKHMDKYKFKVAEVNQKYNSTYKIVHYEEYE